MNDHELEQHVNHKRLKKGKSTTLVEPLTSVIGTLTGLIHCWMENLIDATGNITDTIIKNEYITKRRQLSLNEITLTNTDDSSVH